MDRGGFGACRPRRRWSNRVLGQAGGPGERWLRPAGRAAV